MEQKVFSKRVDKKIYDEASKIYENLGTSVEAAFVMFLRKTILTNGLPFDLKLNDVPNKVTIEALKEDLTNAKRFSTTEELFADLEDEK